MVHNCLQGLQILHWFMDLSETSTNIFYSEKKQNLVCSKDANYINSFMSLSCMVNLHKLTYQIFFNIVSHEPQFI